METLEKLKRYRIRKARFITNDKLRMLLYRKIGICRKNTIIEEDNVFIWKNLYW